MKAAAGSGLYDDDKAGSSGSFDSGVGLPGTPLEGSRDMMASESVASMARAAPGERSGKDDQEDAGEGLLVVEEGACLLFMRRLCSVGKVRCRVAVGAGVLLLCCEV